MCVYVPFSSPRMFFVFLLLLILCCFFVDLLHDTLVTLTTLATLAKTVNYDCARINWHNYTIIRLRKLYTHSS